MDVEIRRLPERRMACWLHVGPYGGLARLASEATAWLRAQKEPGGALETVFLDEGSLHAVAASLAREEGGPHDVHEEEGPPVRVELRVPVSGRVVASPQGDEIPGGPRPAPSRIGAVPEGQVAVVARDGDPRALLPLASALRRFLAAQSFELTPETVIVHLMPSWGDLAAWRAEVHVPVAAHPTDESAPR